MTNIQRLEDELHTELRLAGSLKAISYLEVALKHIEMAKTNIALATSWEAEEGK